MLRDKNSDLSVKELVSNDDFIEYCLHPTEVSKAYWDAWIKEHPQHEDVLNRARSMVMGMHLTVQGSDDATMKSEIWEHIEGHISRSKASQNASVIRLHWKKLAALTASVLLLFMTYQFSSYGGATDDDWLVSTNTSDAVKSIVMADNTRIDLAPGSTVQYASKFNKKIRAIILEGQAFFEVERDTTRPFRVFANETITEVLGTSFSIKTNEVAKNVEIAVVTGKVAVYSHTNNGKTAKSPPMIVKKGNTQIMDPNTKIYLTPNEKVTYNTLERNMIKSIVDDPKILLVKDPTSRNKFKDAPVADVFSTLEAVYGIQIKYDQDALSKCSISTELDDAPMFTKLRMICTALDLRFVERDAIIYIEGAGCN